MSRAPGLTQGDYDIALARYNAGDDPYPPCKRCCAGMPDAPFTGRMICEECEQTTALLRVDRRGYGGSVHAARWRFDGLRTLCGKPADGVQWHVSPSQFEAAQVECKLCLAALGRLAAASFTTISANLDGNKSADLQLDEFHAYEPAAYVHDEGWTCYDLNSDTEYFVSTSGQVYVQPENRLVGEAPSIKEAADRLEAQLGEAPE